jgi:CubicO group peptidase (beta-lactamase class C family)
LFPVFGSESASTPRSIPELQAAIEAVLRDTKTPGAGIAVVSRDKVEWVAGLGKADVALNTPATAETLFRIGSTSKAFAALSALKLHEAGKLKLTDTVRQWVPEVAFDNPWEASDPVRLVHLMEHTTGFDDIHLREYALNDPTPISLAAALNFGASSRVCRWPPGTRMAYCNSGPAVLAAVIEKVSGQRFEDFVAENFFKPLHMDTASYFYTPEVQRKLATLYHSDGVTPYPYWHIAFRPAGAINASAKDMANYVRFYLQRGSLDETQVVSLWSIERMEKTETLSSAQLGKIAGYGLYNYAICEGPFVFRGHAGGVMGGLTDMAYLPEPGRGYCIMINSENSEALGRISKLVRQYVTRGLTPPPLPALVAVPDQVQQHFTGYFQGISPRSQLMYGLERLLDIRQLSVTNNGLSTSVYGFHREQLVPVSARLFRRKDQSIATVALLPDAKGEVLIQFGWATYKKVSELRVRGQVIAIATISLLLLSSPLFALVWGPRKLRGKLPVSGPLSVRLLPLLSTLLFGAFWGVLFLASRRNLWELGVCSWLTVTIMCLSVAFAVTAAAGLFVAWRARFAVMNEMAYWHSVFVGLALLTVASYMGYWGLLGLRLWA